MTAEEARLNELLRRAFLCFRKAHEEEDRWLREMGKLTARRIGMIVIPQAIVYDNCNRKGVEVSQERVEQLLESYAQYTIFLDCMANRCYSKYVGNWVMLKHWQINLAKCLIVHAGEVVPSADLVAEIGASSTGPLPLVRRKVHLLRSILKLPGRGKSRQVIVADSDLGRGYTFSTSEPYCLIDRIAGQSETLGNNLELPEPVRRQPGEGKL